MASKVFLDANILLDFFLKRDDYDNAKKIFGLIADGKMLAFITPSIVHILGYWLTKAFGNARAKELLIALLLDVQVIDISHEVTLLSLNSKIKDIEDALQYYSALHHKIDYFISRDKGLQKAAIAVLPVYSSNELLDELF
jgi:predicted nucleic acid-binding protein